MLQHLFAVMNELLDELLIRYPDADKKQRETLLEQMRMLQSMSDAIVDGWLQVEEKLALLRERVYGSEPNAGHPNAGQPSAGAPALTRPPDGHSASSLPPISAPIHADTPACTAEKPPAIDTGGGVVPSEDARRSMAAGQGYFDLSMYKEAAAAFGRTVRLCPESVMARIYLAMSHMHLQEWDEAQQHFQFAVKLTGHPKLKALGLNALGCIQAVKSNMEQAESYFKQAYEADPTFLGAARNLTSCKESAGKVSLYFGSAELSCM